MTQKPVGPYPASFLELQQRAKVLGGEQELAAKMAAVEYLYLEYQTLLRTIVIDFRELLQLSAQQAAEVLQIDLCLLAQMEEGVTELPLVRYSENMQKYLALADLKNVLAQTKQ